MSHQIGSRTPRRDTYVGFCLYEEEEEAGAVYVARLLEVVLLNAHYLNLLQMAVGTQTVPASPPYILQPCAVGYHSEVCNMSESNYTTDAGKSETTVQRRTGQPERWGDQDVTQYATRSTEMRNKSGHVKTGKSTSKSVGDDFALKC